MSSLATVDLPEPWIHSMTMYLYMPQIYTFEIEIKREIDTILHMSRENTKKLIYLQRFGLLILGSILSMTVFFVVQNTVRAQNDLIVFSTPIIQEEEKTITYDINSDTSLQKYLSANTPFVDTNYIPADLLPINSNFTANTSKAFKLREEAGIQFADMVWHFWNEFH